MRYMILAGLLLMGGCALATGPERSLVLADIAGYVTDDPLVGITTSGTTATIRVTTFGSSCNSKGVTEVVVQDRTATVTPFNYAPPRGTPCPRDLRSFMHEATVDFGPGGTATIHVRGIDARSRSAANLIGDTITVERSVDLQQE